MKKRLMDEDLLKIINKAFDGYEGDATVFMSAVGALILGHRIGWQGVRVCISASTFRKYEKHLGIKFRDVLPPQTKESKRIQGIRMAEEFGKFWQALSGGMIPALEGKIVELGT